MFYVKSIHDPQKHPLIPDDYPWQISDVPLPNSIEISDIDYAALVATFDLTAYNEATSKSQENVEQVLYLKSAAYIGQGNVIADELEKRIWARNTYLGNHGVQLTTAQLLQLLGVTSPIVSALRTGSLQTAKIGIAQIKVAFPVYADIADWGIEALTTCLK